MRQLHRITAFNPYSELDGCFSGEAPDIDLFGSERNDNPDGDGVGKLGGSVLLVYLLFAHCNGESNVATLVLVSAIPWLDAAWHKLWEIRGEEIHDAMWLQTHGCD